MDCRTGPTRRRTAGGLVADVVALDPDIIALQELTPHHTAALLASPVGGHWPHTFLMDRDGPWGSGVWSRLTLADVHTNAPRSPAARQRWEHELALLTDWAGAQGGFLVLAGDGIEVVAVGQGAATGSDHRPVWAQLALRMSAPAASR